MMKQLSDQEGSQILKMIRDKEIGHSLKLNMMNFMFLMKKISK
jgi:hypothetical protein